jgi:uncharacterized protein DUF3489
MTTSKARIKKASAPQAKTHTKRIVKAALLKTDPALKPAAAKRAATTARGASKTDKVLDLLKRPGGVTLKELAKLTGWQPNSVRGFLSGTIGKKMGTPVESFKSSDGDRSYRLPAK